MMDMRRPQRPLRHLRLVFTVVFLATLPQCVTGKPSPTSAGGVKGRPRTTNTHNSTGGGMTLSSRSVLQLNVINADGSLTEVVYPGKQVALELRAPHHGQLGVPVATQCRVLNPLQDTRSQLPDPRNQVDAPFSQTILSHGCGLGEVLATHSGFTKSPSGYSTPLFPLTPSWTLQSALLFACDVIVCADVKRCQQYCPPVSSPDAPNATALGPHDVMVLMESQVVTSCPVTAANQSRNDVDGSWTRSRDCFPDGPLGDQSDGGGNLSAEASGSDVKPGSSTTSWLAGHVHFIIIFSVLGVMVSLFMLAIFCKIVALQRRMEHFITLTTRAEGRRMQPDYKSRGTQTPRQFPCHRNSFSARDTRGNHRARELVTTVNVGLPSESCPLAAQSSSHLQDCSDMLQSSAKLPDGPSDQLRSQTYDVPPSDVKRMSSESFCAQRLHLSYPCSSTRPESCAMSVTGGDDPEPRQKMATEMESSAVSNAGQNADHQDAVSFPSVDAKNVSLQKLPVNGVLSGGVDSEDRSGQAEDKTEAGAPLTSQRPDSVSSHDYYNLPTRGAVNQP